MGIRNDLFAAIRISVAIIAVVLCGWPSAKAQTQQSDQDTPAPVAAAERSSLTSSASGSVSDEQVEEVLSEIVENENLPGLIAAVANADGLMASAVKGVRKQGATRRLLKTDRFHIGSCAKAMTGTMLATLVADEELSWDTSIIDVFPELKQHIHVDYHRATLEQLLRHRAGVPANADDWWTLRTLRLKARRVAFLKQTLQEPPENKPGEFVYSNLGYMIAGAMAERVTGKTWESLMRARLFTPLGMRTAGFGPPGRQDRTDQPWGHEKTRETWKPIYHDNAEVLGPAGRIHCSVEDWAKFAALHLRDSGPEILEREQLNELIDPVGNYAAGWYVLQRPWAHGTVLNHHGSNTYWFAVVWVAPNLNRTFIAATNSSDDESRGICNEIITRLIEIDRREREH